MLREFLNNMKIVGDKWYILISVEENKQPPNEQLHFNDVISIEWKLK